MAKDVAPDPAIGIWKLSVPLSSFTLIPVPKGSPIRVEPWNDGLKVSAETIDALTVIRTGMDDEARMADDLLMYDRQYAGFLRRIYRAAVRLSDFTSRKCRRLLDRSRVRFIVSS